MGAGSSARLVLFVADFFHPFNRFTVEVFLNGNMGHGSRSRGAVPMLFTRRKPDYIAGTNLLDRFPFPLREPAALGDNESLAQWMRMPGGASAGLERYARADCSRGV